MELAWHTQKNQMSDVKGKEMEQERKGKIKNEDIDLDKTKFNYDLVSSAKNLYQRVKERVDFAKQTGSRVQKNSVVMYSNILTVPHEQFEKWGEQKTRDYFKSCYDFFSNEFGKENVVSAKVHLDETSPHMHLHFVPFNKETGKLQARVVMTPKKINEIHDQLPKFLRERGFDVERGSGKTKQNIENIHEYKEVQKVLQEKQNELNHVQLQVEKIKSVIPEKFEMPLLEKEKRVAVISKMIGKPEIIEKETENFVVTPFQYKQFEERLLSVELLKKQNEYLLKENKELKNSEAYRNLEKKFNGLYKTSYEQNQKIVDLEMDNKRLKKENRMLVNKVESLKLEMGLFYLTTKEYLKERVKSPESFQKLFKGILQTFKDRLGVFVSKNENKAFKSHLNVLHGQDKEFAQISLVKTEEISQKNDRGMER